MLDMVLIAWMVVPRSPRFVFKDGWVGLWVSHVQEEADTWCALMVYLYGPFPVGVR